MPILHITNGDSTRAGLERSSVPGTFSSWSDILHEGPTPANVPAEEWRRVRVAYLESQYGGGDLDIAEKYRREDSALERWADYDEVVFWFEHDLYDQLLLIRHLAWLGARGARGPQAGSQATRLSLVCGDTYLGPLAPEQFPALFALREPITGAQIALGTRAWDAFCAKDPRGLLPLASTPSIDLPFLPGALHRYLEEFPSTENGLARTERQILTILAAREQAPDRLFAALLRTEERIFMGDSGFWKIVERLAACAHPLVALDVRERPGRLPDGLVRITDTGRDVLAGGADHLALNGIDRWMGGVRLGSPRCWRWDGAGVAVANCRMKIAD